MTQNYDDASYRPKKPVPPRRREYSIKEALGLSDELEPTARPARKAAPVKPRRRGGDGAPFDSLPRLSSTRKPVATPARIEPMRNPVADKSSHAEQSTKVKLLPPIDLVGEEDRELVAFEEVTNLVRDRVKQVASGTSTGLILWGGGGTGKSHAVLETLKELDVPFQLLNTQVTPKGLYNSLKERPTDILIIEDAESLFANQLAAGLLRSALYANDKERNGNGRLTRTVTWQTARTSDRIEFTGGLIIISNRSLPDTPEMEAVKTRVPVIEFNVSPAQIKAKMRELASKEYVDGDLILSALQCQEVCEFIIEQAERAEARPELRLLENGLRDRASWELGETTTSWQGLISSRIKEAASAAAKPPKSKASETRRQVDILEQLAARLANERKMPQPLRPQHGVKKALARMLMQQTDLTLPTALRRVDAYFDQQAKRQPPSGKA